MWPRGPPSLPTSHLAYISQWNIRERDRCIDCELADRCVFGVSFLLGGENRDRGDIGSMSAALPLRDPAYNSAGRGNVGDCGDCGFLSKFLLADSPKKGLSSRTRIRDVGREGGRGSRGLKSSGCVELVKLPKDLLVLCMLLQRLQIGVLIRSIFIARSLANDFRVSLPRPQLYFLLNAFPR
jgi:hypothetical protein